MQLEFQNKTNIEIIGFKLMHSGFALVSTDIDLGNIRFLRYLFRFYQIQISPVNLSLLYKTSWRCLQDMYSRLLKILSSICLEYVFNATIFCLLRRLQDISRRLSRCLQDVLMASWKMKIFTLKTCCRHLQGMSGRRLEDQQMFAGSKLITLKKN